VSIDDYMTPNEAAYKYGVNIERLKEKLKPSRNQHLDELIYDGLIKYFKHPDKTRGEWIISKDFMEKYYN